ncbi:MAG: 4Fe-4S binding protein [Candidatus Eremiobacterota bacterium]
MAKGRFVLSFPPTLVEEPLTYHLVKDYNIITNILRAKITAKEEGRLVVEMIGELEPAIKYLEEKGVRVEHIATEILIDETLCVHCGACGAVCFPKALRIDRETFELKFDREKCTLCELCLKACPVRAISSNF